MAVAGLGGKGPQAVRDIFRTPGTRLTGLCDPDTERLDKQVKMVYEEHGIKAPAYTDVRKLLESKEVDALVVTSPNHWHALMTIWACQAGKDVYVEKPVFHTLWEGQQMLAAAKKHNRIVQSGLQSRSDAGLKAGIAWVNEGHLGAIREIRVINYDNRKRIGKRDTPLEPPATCDYDLWLGPAQDEPIYRDRLHYDWHWDWNTGNGDMGNSGVHELDVARMLLGDPGHPDSLVSFGGRFVYNDAGETPNMQQASYSWKGQVPVVYELRDLAIDPKTNAIGNYRGRRYGVLVDYEGGEFRGARGGATILDKQGKRIKQFEGDGGFDHFPAFIRAVRSRKESDTGCTLKNGYLSTALCNLANISVRTGTQASTREVIAFAGREAVLEESTERLLDHLKIWDVDLDKTTWSLGQVLGFDGEMETIIEGQDVQSARKLLTRKYRKGFAVPKLI